MRNRTLSALTFPGIYRLIGLLVLCGSFASVAASAISVSTTTSLPSPQPVNTSITLTATATGGTQVQYQFWVYNANATPTWQQLQAYSASATCTWTPSLAGNYLLSVTALDGSAAANTTCWYAIIGIPLSAVSVTPSPASPQPVNTPITLTAKATGGSDVQFQFWVYNANASPAWSQLQGYSASPTCTWTPATAGNYLLSATAQDESTGAGVNTMLWYVVTGGPLVSVSATAAPASPQPINTQVTFTATATGGTSLQYQFWVYNANASPAWSQLQGYSASTTCAWTPGVTGDYLLSVTALDSATGTAANTTFWYTIGTPLSAVSVTVSPTSPQPVSTPITLTAKATGGSDVQFQFWVYNANASPAWSQLQGYSPATTCAWASSVPGNYFFSVTAQDPATGTAVNTMLGYTLTANPLTGVSMSATPESPQQAFTPITLLATATGGAVVQYQYWVYRASVGDWSQLQAYSATGTCIWMPEAADNYLLSVTAQDTTTGTAVNSLNWYTVTSAPQNPVDGADMVWVPAGNFIMGSSLPGDDISKGETQTVTLTGYWIYTNEVTVEQYLEFCAATGHDLPSWPGPDFYSWMGTGWTDSAVQQFPIVNVSWNDAQAYATWAGVSLPTEAQYEYAARGPQENNFPWGGTATAANPCNGWDKAKCANYWNSYLQGVSTWPVGSFPQGTSWCGAEDLAGNVWEWCQDWYGDYAPTPVTNPTGPATGTYHVLRGGSWYNGVGEDFYRGAFRNSYYYPIQLYPFLMGFRCVSHAPGPKNPSQP